MREFGRDDEKLTDDQLRSGRKHPVRARVIAVGRLPQKERRRLALLYPEASEGYWRPKTRADCESVPRPCPFVGCRFSLYLDVQESTGGIKVNFPDIEPDEMRHSCVLDIADAGGVTLERTGALLNITRERVRQLETKAIDKVASVSPELADLVAGWTHPRG